MARQTIDILLITGGGPENRSVATNIDKLVQILSQLKGNIRLITLCDKKLISNISQERIYSLRIEGNRFKRFFLMQILPSWAILRARRQAPIQITMLAYGQDLQILPVLLAKLVSRKVIIRSDGRPTIVIKKYIKQGTRVKIGLFKMIEEINYRLADVLLTECDYMISENDFTKYHARNGALYVEVDSFAIKRNLRDRTYDIGFIGRLNREKGILCFLAALRLLTESHNLEAKVIIIGDGEQKRDVLNSVPLLKPQINIEYTGWVQHSQLPDYLNGIKIVVVPSYKEGLPNIVLESMACGCVVLAAPIGGIPGVVKDGESGFIMEDNSPEAIARNIVRAMNHPGLDKITMNARALIEKEFSYEAVVRRYREILGDFP